MEDEILKVAVMKYGRNQWARISSLLVRKTPKQCKARWNEWLDPRVKKTEWSREEDEKLLHLTKVFPSQWGTIADLVGRTAQMCVERYERLLELSAGGNTIAEASSTVGEVSTRTATSLGEARKLKPGEIDPSPETKAARPDPVDMDEDEKEMLAEARARLANTQGKKAKRKAREKLLDEARRLAFLQKRRDMIAAGLPVMPGRKRRGMDYNAEVPFEHKAVPGFHDATEELEREQVAHQDAIKLSAEERKEQAIGSNRDIVELTERKKDVTKEKKRIEQGFLPTALERRLKEQQAARRLPLNLPLPQIGASELEQIAKYEGEIGRWVAESEVYATPATAALRPGYTPSRRMGYEGTPLTRSSVGNSTPMSTTSTSKLSKASRTSARSTPIRDTLGINNGIREPIDSSTILDVYQKRRLQDAFSRLPKPKNDFDIVMPSSSDQ